MVRTADGASSGRVDGTHGKKLSDPIDRLTQSKKTVVPARPRQRRNSLQPPAKSLIISSSIDSHQVRTNRILINIAMCTRTAVAFRRSFLFARYIIICVRKCVFIVLLCMFNRSSTDVGHRSPHRTSQW